MGKVKNIFHTKILISSFIIANIIVLIETYVDAYKESKPFLAEIFTLNPHELLERLSFFLIFLIFGCSISIVYKKIKTSEEEKTRIIHELEAANKEIKILRGIIPICSFCKKVRDDQGYWNQIETYIKNHSEADFSHSFCEECARIHYPDFIAEKRDIENPSQ